MSFGVGTARIDLGPSERDLQLRAVLEQCHTESQNLAHISEARTYLRSVRESLLACMQGFTHHEKTDRTAKVIRRIIILIQTGDIQNELELIRAELNKESEARSSDHLLTLLPGREAQLRDQLRGNELRELHQAHAELRDEVQRLRHEALPLRGPGMFDPARGEVASSSASAAPDSCNSCG